MANRDVNNINIVNFRLYREQNKEAFFVLQLIYCNFAINRECNTKIRTW